MYVCEVVEMQKKQSDIRLHYRALDKREYIVITRNNF